MITRIVENDWVRIWRGHLQVGYVKSQVERGISGKTLCFAWSQNQVDRIFQDNRLGNNRNS